MSLEVCTIHEQSIRNGPANTLLFCPNYILELDSAYYTSKRFGGGTGPIFVDYINCTGTEPRIYGRCSYFSHSYGCSHYDDVGVQCQPGL